MVVFPCLKAIICATSSVSYGVLNFSVLNVGGVSEENLTPEESLLIQRIATLLLTADGETIAQ